jgi:hypothetical protein
MANITIKTAMLVEGTSYKSFAELCRELVLYNGVPVGTPTNPVGSRKAAILRELERYVEIERNPKINRNALVIKTVFATPKPQAAIRAGQSNIAKYMRPILCDMINKEYHDTCIIKYHKGLTVDLRYMPLGYIELYNAIYENKFNEIPRITNVERYAEYVMRKFINYIKDKLNYYSVNLNYDGVKFEKMAFYTVDLDFLDYADQKLYAECEKNAKEELEERTPPDIRVDYRKIPVMANEEYNERKKIIDPNYNPVYFIKAYVFEIDDTFTPNPQILNAKQLNQELINTLKRRRDILLNYKQSDEYAEIISEFAKGKLWGTKENTNPLLCSDKDVRQMLTINNRENTAEKESIDEREVPLDFSIVEINSYVDDIQLIIDECKIQN